MSQKYTQKISHMDVAEALEKATVARKAGNVVVSSLHYAKG